MRIRIRNDLMIYINNAITSQLYWILGGRSSRTGTHIHCDIPIAEFVLRQFLRLTGVNPQKFVHCSSGNTGLERNKVL